MNTSLKNKHTKEYSAVCHSSPLVVRLRRLVMILVLMLIVYQPSAYSQSGNADDIRYTLSPVGSRTIWNSNLGLKDGFFYGGKLGIDFGPLIGLEVSYLTSDNLWTDFSLIDLRDTVGAVVDDQRVKVRRYGGDLIVRWPTDRIAPFVKLGGGIIQFEPESGPKVEKIDVRVGGGLDYLVTNRLRTRAWIEMNRFRLDRYALAPGGTTNVQYPIDPEAEEIRNNFSIGLSFDYAIGQSRFRNDRTDQRIQPFSLLELEPMLGRMEFKDSRMSTVTVAGLRIGGELNPWVGWGLYYWHGMESDLSDTKPLQSYGGEARFSLASKEGPQPYVTIGTGQIDFLSGYTDADSIGRDDKTALILGAGIRAEIVSGLQLNVSARDLMYGEERLDRISGTNDISHNWLLSGALVFGIGGHSRETKSKPTGFQPDFHASGEVLQQKDTTKIIIEKVKPQDTTKVVTPPVPSAKLLPSGYVSEKTVVIPVPLEGEIYIRYGKAVRDMGETVLKGSLQTQEIIIDSTVQKTQSIITGSVDSTKVPSKVLSSDTTVQVNLKPRVEQIAPVTRSEIDSLIYTLKSDIGLMLAAQAEKPRPSVTVTPLDTTKTVVTEDSVIIALKAKLATSESERKRLDSLLRVSEPITEIESDSLIELRIKKEIADQVAATLAAIPKETKKEFTQADLQDMMAMLTNRMDSVTSKQSSYDSARLRDQLQLEIVKQTKSQEEYKRAMDELVKRNRELQEERTSNPPAIIITQPAPSTQVLEREKPSTIVIQPDTQFVVIQDSAGINRGLLPITNVDVNTFSEEKDFIDLRPTAYTGFGLEKPKQFIIGGRLDIGPITTKEDRLRLVPEFALGLGGGGVSVMAVMNAEYNIAIIESGDYRIVPYTRLGFGVIGFGGDISDRDTEGVLNFTYGISVDPKKIGLFRDFGDPVLFIEHQIIDLFDLNRVVLGFQWSR